MSTVAASTVRLVVPLGNVSAIPLSYADMAADIAARIKSGEYEPGAKLPSYSQLAELYPVSFSTAAGAVALL